MAINYNNLWKLLIDRGMTKTDLRIKAGLTTSAIAQLGKNEYVSLKVIEKYQMLLQGRRVNLLSCFFVCSILSPLESVFPH